MIRDKVHDLLSQAISKTGINDTDIALAHPADSNHGDFATSIALKHAKIRGVAPMELAQQITENIVTSDIIAKAEVVKPGFINVFLTIEALLSDMNTAHVPDNQSKEKKKTLIEFGQPNTHKLPHIGHLFSYVFGESLSRIYEYWGHDVIRANYQGDIGLHVAKCLWYVVSNKKDLESVKSLKDKVDFLQKGYQQGSHAYEHDGDAKQEIDAINQSLYKEQDAELKKLWKETRQWCVDYYDEFQKRLGITYDRQYFETETWKVGKETVESNIGAVFEKSQNAVIFRGEDHGLHTRVFINKHGNPTYEGKEIGLYEAKMRDFAPFDLSITTTASEQNQYFKVVFKAIEKLHPESHALFKHLGYGMINLSSGKMSSRTGEIVGAIELVELTKEAIADSFEMTDDSLAEKVAIAAVKYSFLKSDPYKNMTFDLEKSIAREGDSGPYILYTYVRTRSIHGKSDKMNNSLNDVVGGDMKPEELSLLRLLYQFPEVIETAAKQYSPSTIATYLFSLAQSYNLFYQKHQILKADDAQKSLRLALTSKVGIILKTGLHLLGIETVEKM